MRCYWATEKGQKFWIPGCHQGLYVDDGVCVCRKWDKMQPRKAPSEEKEYKKFNNRLLKENERLAAEIERLNQQLKDK